MNTVMKLQDHCQQHNFILNIVHFLLFMKCNVDYSDGQCTYMLHSL